MVAAALLLHLVLAVPPDALPPVTLTQAVAEAAALWAPHGVIVDAAVPWSAPDTDAVLLKIVFVTIPSARDGGIVGPRWRGPLASIAFGSDGAPESTITVYLTDILQFIREARVFGAEHWRWPTMMRDRTVGRVIGRVIAHEIGHYVLQTPQHTASGLMRPVQSAEALAGPSRRMFALPAGDAWRAAVDRRNEKGPASAGPLHQTTAKP
jgi:hypothetical protein